jgi:Catalytic LigB subunit of aromatic ring-opening dioxygenase
MAEILTVGISHYPPLHGSDQRMSAILKHMLQNPKLPAHLRTPQGWPAAMRAEWADDEGTMSAKQHREQLLGWLRKVRASIDAFKPDFVLIWGDDQYENFKEDVIPPYCICAYPSFEYGPPPANIWNEPVEKRFRLAGNVAAGKHLASGLIEQGFDAAYSYKPLHHPLGHAFTNAIMYLDYDRSGFDHPILPFAINSYGRKVIVQRGGFPRFDQELGPADMDPPAPTPKRLFDLGAATARILADSPWRVALLASSGWSHAFLTPKTHLLHPDTAADHKLYDALRTGDYDTWRNYPAAAIEESGQQEVLNWMCLAGAMKELKHEPTQMGVVDTWIFNSTKVFLVAQPVV